MSGVFVNGECVSGSCMILNYIPNVPQLLGVVLILAGILMGVAWYLNKRAIPNHKLSNKGVHKING